ncbi:hypothetical protein [Clostridium sp. VAP51]|nr:hypothetical protein [Clostridium sp. VAP51]
MLFSCTKTFVEDKLVIVLLYNNIIYSRTSCLKKLIDYYDE